MSLIRDIIAVWAVVIMIRALILAAGICLAVWALRSLGVL